MKNILKIAFINIITVLIIYLLFVNFSYIFFPFKKEADAVYNFEINRFDGYHKFKPGNYYNPDYNINFYINSEGFRDNENIYTVKAIRIGVVGGSSVQGIESPDNKTWTHQLELALNLNENKYKVFNFGQSGLTSENIISLLNEELINYGLDYLIYYGGYNEYSYNHLERYPGFDLYPNILSFYNYFILSKVFQVQILLEKIFKIRISFLEKKLNSFQNKYYLNLKEISNICFKNDINLVLVNQLLNMSSKKLKNLSNNNFSRNNFITDISFLNKNHIMEYRNLFIYEQLLNLKNENIILINLFNNYQPIKNNFFYDFVHLSPEGNEFIAKQIAKKIN